MTDSILFSPIQIGDFHLKSRLAYAPLTRRRAIDMVPNEAMAKYYAQRAHDGVLLISEGTVVAHEGLGYSHVPGIWRSDQVEAWKPATKAVKEKGAVFFMQLWHVGRASIPELQPEGRSPIGPSAVAIPTDNSNLCPHPETGKMVPYAVPRALETSEIPGVVQQFADGARNAIKAGFDGVEIHGANGYLLSQFLHQNSNLRDDQYGGSIENRCRFVLEVVDAVVKAIGSKKVGIRLSPYNWTFLDSREPDVESVIKLNTYLVEQLNKYDLAYLHLVTARIAGGGNSKDRNAHETQPLTPFRKAFKGPVIAAGAFIKETAEQEIEKGAADMIAFGRLWLANPDFPERLRKDAPLNKYDRPTFYLQDPVKGYTDYPVLEDVPEGTPTFTHYSGAVMFDTSGQAKKDQHSGVQP